MDRAATEEPKSSSNPQRKLPQTHILVFPVAYLGHAIPLFSLTHRLLSLSHYRLTATLILTPAIIPHAESLLSSHPPHSLQTLILTPPSPPPRSRIQQLLATLHSYHALRDPILSWFRSHPNPPHVIISDIFLGWTEHLASELHIPRVVFSPSGAFGTTMYYSIWAGQPQNPDVHDHEDPDPDHLVQLDRIHGSPVFPWWQLWRVYTDNRIAPDYPVEVEFFRESMVANLSSWATVFNTFDELELNYLSQLKKVLGHGRVWAVGPLLQTLDHHQGRGNTTTTESTAGHSGDEVQAAMKWLNKQADSSVVYICFGSREKLDSDQVEALTRAIKTTKMARFLWCGGLSEVGVVIPNNDLEDYQRRVMVLNGWVPQLEILRHRSVGAFVTHCGWNSVLEAITSGVKMLAWPLGADQFVDARLVVEAGVAVQVECVGPKNVPKVVEFARVLDESVMGGGGETEEKVRWLREAAENAVECGGSSHRDLSELLKSLEGLGCGEDA